MTADDRFLQQIKSRLENRSQEEKRPRSEIVSILADDVLDASEVNDWLPNVIVYRDI